MAIERSIMAALRIGSGILVWALHFGAIYGMTALACARAGTMTASLGTSALGWGIVLATAIALGMIVAILLPAARAARQRGFEAWLTASVAALAGTAILWEALVSRVVSGCE